MLQRLILAAAGFGVSAINGIEHAAGVLDFIGGAMLIAALFPWRRMR